MRRGFREYEGSRSIAVAEDTPQREVVKNGALDVCFSFLLVVHKMDAAGFG